jgi:hypothetical protein
MVEKFQTALDTPTLLLLDLLWGQLGRCLDLVDQLGWDHT